MEIAHSTLHGSTLQQLARTYVQNLQRTKWCWKAKYYKVKSVLNFMFCWTCILIVFVMATNLMHYLSFIYFIRQTLHVTGIFTAHHQEVFTVYVQQLIRQDGTVVPPWPGLLSVTKTYNTYQLLTYTVNTCWWWAVHMLVTWRGWLTN
jgi:hypothetical protein